MGAQSPPHMLCFITVCVTAAISIIALALSGTLTNVYGYCRVGSSTTCGGPAVGITAGVLGMLIGVTNQSIVREKTNQKSRKTRKEAKEKKNRRSLRQV